ncbi:MAG: hypothetical protein IKA73_01365 [Alphaproteobacteria bacterium]|nr:hypothetical protein [Alphaproteobacteria bacterium]
MPAYAIFFCYFFLEIVIFVFYAFIMVYGKSENMDNEQIEEFRKRLSVCLSIYGDIFPPRNKKAIEPKLWDEWKKYINACLVGCKTGEKNLSDITQYDVFSGIFGNDVLDILNFIRIEDINKQEKLLKELLEICASIVKPPRDKRILGYEEIQKQIKQDYKVVNSRIMAGCALYSMLLYFEEMYCLIQQNKKAVDSDNNLILFHFVGCCREIFDVLYRFKNETLSQHYKANKSHAKSNELKNDILEIARDMRRRNSKLAQSKIIAKLLSENKYTEIQDRIISDLQTEDPAETIRKWLPPKKDDFWKT